MRERRDGTDRIDGGAVTRENVSSLMITIGGMRVLSVLCVTRGGPLSSDQEAN